MTKRVSLDRLRDISKQRSIRRPPAAVDHGAEAADRIEWPVPGEDR
jgi:hypothetical protein